MSHPVVKNFGIIGPDNVEYNGTFCLPQVPLVTNVTFEIGDNITIQVIEVAQHGAAIYNVSRSHCSPIFQHGLLTSSKNSA